MRKHQISISILLSLLILVLAIISVKIYNDSREEENYISTKEIVKNTQNESVITNQEYVQYQFYLKDDDGRLTVYWVKNSEIYLYTGIETRSFSEEMQQKLKQGIYFENETQLYDFLESYSS